MEEIKITEKSAANQQDSTEIKISQALEKQQEKEQQDQIANALNTGETKKDGRNILLMLGIMLGTFAFFMGGFKVYDYVTGAAINKVVNLDYLHQKNAEGKLDPSRGYLYQSYSFVYNDGLWWTQIKKGNTLLKIPLHFGPKNVSNIKITGTLDKAFNNGTDVHIAIDPEFANKHYSLALSELNFNVVKGIKRRPVGVCTKNNTICENRNVLSCNNTKGKPVIELRPGNQSHVKLQGTCILISGKDYGIVKAVDRLILRWYGIMK